MRPIYIPLVGATLVLAACGDTETNSPKGEEPRAVEGIDQAPLSETSASDDSETPDANGWREARCDIESGGDGYVGPCEFLSEENGTFTVRDPTGEQIFGATSITVAMTAPGEAEVRGLTEAGLNSRWGAAQRSEVDRACWDGPDFRVCAY